MARERVPRSWRREPGPHRCPVCGTRLDVQEWQDDDGPAAGSVVEYSVECRWGHYTSSYSYGSYGTYIGAAEFGGHWSWTAEEWAAQRAAMAPEIERERKKWRSRRKWLLRVLKHQRKRAS